MKKIFFIAIAIAAFTSCKKDKDTPAFAKTVLMSKWNWVYGTNGANNGYESYTFNAGNELSASVFYNSETATAPVSKTYTRNAAGQVVKAQRSTGYTAYEYNSSGQLSKSSSYNTSGTLSSYYLYNYSADGYEQVSYSAAGVAGSKLVCTYTADKKNIAKETWYNSRGDVSLQVEYTYLTTKRPESVYPYSEVYILDRGFVSQNAINIATSSAPGNSTATTTYTYTYNGEGYPLTQKETYSNGDAPSNMTFEYIVK